MKYILTLFAVVMLVAYSNASPYRKHDIEKCHKKVSGFLAASGNNHDPGHLKTILKCFERNDFDACNADIKSNAQNMAILVKCQSEIEGLISSHYSHGHGDGIAKCSKSSKSSKSSTSKSSSTSESSSKSESSSDCDCNGTDLSYLTCLRAKVMLWSVLFATFLGLKYARRGHLNSARLV